MWRRFEKVFLRSWSSLRDNGNRVMHVVGVLHSSSSNNDVIWFIRLYEWSKVHKCALDQSSHLFPSLCFFPILFLLLSLPLFFLFLLLSLTLSLNMSLSPIPLSVSPLSPYAFPTVLLSPFITSSILPSSISSSFSFFLSSETMSLVSFSITPYVCFSLIPSVTSFVSVGYIG